jgi:hypothetical protein
MEKLALSLPWQGGNQIINPGFTPNPAFDPRGATLGSVITTFGQLALYVGGFLMFFWAAWGVFDYIRAEGNKEALAKARKRIQWAIVGFIILLLSFFLSDFVKTVLNPGLPPLTNIEIK